jgi:hypothetical protein
MKRVVTALVAIAALAGATIATTGSAEARWGWGHRWGWGPGPVFGGFVAGTLIGSALASPYYYPHYYGPYPYGPGPCAWRSYWNGYHWVRACY